MDEEAIRGVAETVFRRCFSDVELVRVNVQPGLDHDGDPVVDLRIVYDDKHGKVASLSGAGVLRMRSEVHSKFWINPAQYPGFPVLYFIALSELGKSSPEAA